MDPQQLGNPGGGSQQSARSSQYARFGADVLSRMEKVPSELLALTYGSLITQLMEDLHSDTQQMNDALDRMGEQMGARLVDEFLAKTQNIVTSFPLCCQDFPDLCEIIATVGFKMYLGVAAEVANVSEKSCDFILRENPLSEFVEIPAELQSGGLWYSNILAGAVRGALAAVGVRTRVYFVEDVTRDDNDITRIACELIEYMVDEFDD
ncbi:unnamed protein product [Amoebophrya sp. A120]|nr:unnamed protein product [Amoebophrya sp. A120]|eukprot:GSA120T00011860001.1